MQVLYNPVSGSLGNETFGWVMYKCIQSKPYPINTYPIANEAEKDCWRKLRPLHAFWTTTEVHRKNWKVLNMLLLLACHGFQFQPIPYNKIAESPQLPIYTTLLLAVFMYIVHNLEFFRILRINYSKIFKY